MNCYLHYIEIIDNFEKNNANRMRTNRRRVKFSLIGTELSECNCDFLGDGERLIIMDSKYQMINGSYIKKGIINGKPHWFKTSKKLSDIGNKDDIGYHIYLADITKGRWVISNGRRTIYECITKTLL
jgi:hypothetical protein